MKSFSEKVAFPGTERYGEVMNMDEAFEGLICIGCAMMAANGDDIGDGGDGIYPLAECDGMHVIVGEEWGFASSRCDGCGSRLGGDRHEATFVPIGK